MWGAYSAPTLDSSHGKLIPWVVLALLWMKREQLAGLIDGVWWPALFLLAAALVIHLIGFIVQQPRVSIIALFLGFYSFVGLVWGWRILKATFYPFVLFAFCMPLGTFVENLTLSLRLMATSITALITRDLLGIEVVRQGTQIFAVHGAYNYDVTAACSGIRSFIALLALTIVYGMMTFKSFWRRTFIILLSIPLAIFCNVLRLITIIIVSEAAGQKAGEFVHEWFGFVTYAVAIGCVMLVSIWLKEKPAGAAS